MTPTEPSKLTLPTVEVIDALERVISANVTSVNALDEVEEVFFYLRLAVQRVAELRARIHEAVDECQKRHAPFVARCADFDRWSAEAAKEFDDGKPWFFRSETERLLIVRIIGERDTFRRERDEVVAAKNEQHKVLSHLYEGAVEDSTYFQKRHHEICAERDKAVADLREARAQVKMLAAHDCDHYGCACQAEVETIRAALSTKPDGGSDAAPAE